MLYYFQWTEKEFRNLTRVNRKSRINAPEALLFKDHILVGLKCIVMLRVIVRQVMSFIGKNSIPALQLKEINKSSLSVELWTDIYFDVLSMIYTLFHKCHLVHADLSEYNVLRHEEKTYLIDFGQAVDISHPEHLVFMLRDIENITSYFSNREVLVLDPASAMSVILQDYDEILVQEHTVPENLKCKILNLM